MFLYFKPCSVKGGLNASTKITDTRQSALSTQADMGRNLFAIFYLLFSASQRSCLAYDSADCWTKRILWNVNYICIIGEHLIGAMHHGDALTLYQTTKFYTQSKLKAFADDKLNMIQMAKFVLDKIENIVGKEENAGYCIFFFPRNVFKSLFLQGR